MEVWSEPEGAVTDVAMAQWEEASVVTVRANVAGEGMELRQRFKAMPSPYFFRATLLLCLIDGASIVCSLQTDLAKIISQNGIWMASLFGKVVMCGH